MAKQASKPKPGAAGRAGAAPAKAAPKPSSRKKTTPAPAAPAKRRPPSRTATKPKAPSAKGAKLQAAGKAITSRHAPSPAKPDEAGGAPLKNKQPAGSAPSPKASPAKAKGASPSGPARKKGRTAKRVTFDRKTLLGIKKSLEDQRKDLVGQLEELEESAFSPGQAEASSEAGSDDDYADAGTVTFEREKDLSIANNINNLLDKIDKALEKIEEGSYGICENCGQPIGADRLKALPHVVLCINCKKAEERR